MKRITLALPSPYVGLRPFEEDDALLFFGRDEHVDELVAKLAGTRFVAVVGASGSGKSSLVRAGLIPALHRGALPRSARRWNVYIVRPGDAPLLNLARELARDERWLGGMDRATGEQYLRSLMASSPLALAQLYASLQQQFEDEACVVVVDQFEEIFRYRQRNVDEAEAFVKLLLRTATAPERQLHVLLTMRADFLGNCMAFHGLPEALNSGLYLTPRLNREQLLSVIVSPLALVGGTIDPVLANHLVNNLTRDDELPVLQHKLLRMWDHARARGRAQLEFADFEAVSRRATSIGEQQSEAAEPVATNAIDIHASEVYDRLPSDNHRSVAQQVFVLLTDRREGRDVRHPRELAELVVFLGEDHRAELMKVLEAYRAHGVGFLVPPASTPLSDQAMIDISHESLIRQWESLQRWLEDEEADASGLQEWKQRTQRHLAGAGDLLNVADSARAESWLERLARRQRGGGWASRCLGATDPSFEQIQHFIHGSRAELDRQRRRRRYLGGAVVVAALLVAVGFAWLWLGAAASALEAKKERDHAKQAEDRAIDAAAKANMERDNAKLAEDRAKDSELKAVEEKKRAENSEARSTSALNQVQVFGDAYNLEQLRKQCPLAALIASGEQSKKDNVVGPCAEAVRDVKELMGRQDQRRKTEQELGAKQETKGGIQHTTVSQLIRDLDALQAMVDKLRRVYDAAKWEKAIAAIVQSERYNGLKLTPTFDLVPLGEDPDFGLSEFVHAQSGAVPERDSQGRLIVTAETGVVLVLMPGGAFQMGSDKAGSWETPIHKVTVPPFFMAKHELTEGQLARLTGKQSTRDGLRPAVNVSFDDAKQLAVPLVLRLPTEAEWEYAARAGTTTEYWWGEEVQQGGKVWANCSGCGGKWDGKETAPVGSFAPNPFGLYDTAGNVWEWVEDCYHDSYVGAPTDGSAWVSGSCAERVIRGGGWGSEPHIVRSANRYWLAPDFRNSDLGFRLARTLP